MLPKCALCAAFLIATGHAVVCDEGSCDSAVQDDSSFLMKSARISKIQVKHGGKAPDGSSPAAIESMVRELVEKAVYNKTEVPDDTKAALQSIDDEMTNIISSSKVEHEEDVGEVNRAAMAIESCVLAVRNSSSSTLLSSADDARDDHATCRTKEKDLKNIMDADCKEYSDTYKHWTEAYPPCASSVTTAAISEVESLLECIESIAFWAEEANHSIYTTKKKCDDATEDYSTWPATCKTMQSSFEMATCSYFATQSATCSTQESCLATQIGLAEETYSAVNVSMKARMAEYESALHIQCLLKVLSASEDEQHAKLEHCMSQTYDSSEFLIDFPDRPAAEPCVVPSTKPCDDVWVAEEYSELDSPADTCTACPALPSSTTVTASIGDSLFTSRMSASVYHTAVVKEDGSVWTTGHNDKGQLGDGTITERHSFVQVMEGDDQAMTGGQAVSTLDRATIVLKQDGTVWSFGWNRFGQLGDETWHDRWRPVQVMTGVKAVSSGGEGHTVVLKQDGTIWTVGGNSYAQLGDGTRTDSFTPVQVMTDAQAVSSGFYFNIVLKQDGTVWTWGKNVFGELGDGTTTDRLSPAQVMTGGKAVAAGGHYAIVLKQDGTVWTFGQNNIGQLGDGTTSHQYSPVQATWPTTGAVAMIGAGHCVIMLKQDGTVWTIGNGRAWTGEELGDGMKESDYYNPVQVAITGGQAVAVGYAHFVVLKADGTVWTWGWNHKGQLGDGTTSDVGEMGPRLFEA